MKWAVNMYSQWRINKMGSGYISDQIVNANLDVINEVSKADLCFALSRFICEVKKLDGSEYPPNTLREIIIMVQMYLNEQGIYWKLLDDIQFVYLRNVLDNTMKERHADGLGVRRSSEIISTNIEDTLFTAGILGGDSPLKLLRTVIYMVGLHCALRGGTEHDKLRRPGFDCQLNVELDECGIERLVYHEDPLQKTNQGGLLSKSNNKIVYVYGSSNMERCPLYYFKKYIGLLPVTKGCAKLYMRPKKKFTLSTWYCDQPYGFNRIKTTVKEVCKEAGIEGIFTNHSLRATCASRMFSNNVPEQIIKEVPGHRSDCVRVYKRTSDSLRKVASETVSAALSNNGQEMQKPIEKKVKKKVKEPKEKGVLSMSQMILNVAKTKFEMRKKKYPKSRLKLTRNVKGQRVQIEFNFDVKAKKKEIKINKCKPTK